MDYHTTLRQLFDTLSDCNRADSDQAQPWQDARDSWVCFSHIRKAIKELAGQEIIDHWATTGEVNLALANRNNKEGKPKLLGKRVQIKLDARIHQGKTGTITDDCPQSELFYRFLPEEGEKSCWMSINEIEKVLE